MSGESPGRGHSGWGSSPSKAQASRPAMGLGSQTPSKEDSKPKVVSEQRNAQSGSTTSTRKSVSTAKKVVAMTASTAKCDVKLPASQNVQRSKGTSDCQKKSPSEKCESPKLSQHGAQEVIVAQESGVPLTPPACRQRRRSLERQTLQENLQQPDVVTGMARLRSQSGGGGKNAERPVEVAQRKGKSQGFPKAATAANLGVYNPSAATGGESGAVRAGVGKTKGSPEFKQPEKPTQPGHHAKETTRAPELQLAKEIPALVKKMEELKCQKGMLQVQIDYMYKVKSMNPETEAFYDTKLLSYGLELATVVTEMDAILERMGPLAETYRNQERFKEHKVNYKAQSGSSDAGAHTSSDEPRPASKPLLQPASFSFQKGDIFKQVQQEQELGPQNPAPQVPGGAAEQRDTGHVAVYTVPRIAVLGPPASGKHTMAQLLCKRLNATHLTPETLLSNDVSALVEEALAYKGSDQEIPDALWARLVQERLSEVDCARRGWVMEGFPRTREQGLLLQMSGTCPDHIVVLDAPDIVLIERNMGKRIDPTTGEVYHTTFDWPEDPEVQRNLVEPAGTSEEETGRRLLEYHRNIPGILRAFPKIYKKINADQPCMDVFSQALTFVLSQPRSPAPYTPRILLYGPPGSGRSLQAALLAQKYDIVNISCGQVLKEAVADRTEAGLVMQPYIENQQQVPDNLALRVLCQRLGTLDCSAGGWVLHGFPRDSEQAALLNDAGYTPNRIFFLDISDDVAIERLSLRMTDPVSGERYHGLYKPAPRVEVHARLQQRPADGEQEVQARLDAHHASAEELQEFYQDVIHVNADQDPHTVFEFIESCIVRPLPKRVPGGPPSP